MTEATEKAIAANLEAMRLMLRTALAAADAAAEFMAKGDRNAAIGTVIDLDRVLADATALHGASIALHRRAA